MMLMELLRNLQTFDQLRRVTNASLADLAEITSENFRSIGPQREDSLVFVMGLLNLGTILCYTIYNQLFKSVNLKSSAWPLTEDFLSKKIQSILDELVLHVHTTSYYRSALDHEQEQQGRSFHNRRPTAPVMERRTLFTGDSFFDLSSFEAESSARISSSDSRLHNYINGEVRKLMTEWLTMLGLSQATTRVKRQALSGPSATYPPTAINGDSGVPMRRWNSDSNRPVIRRRVPGRRRVLVARKMLAKAPPTDTAERHDHNAETAPSADVDIAAHADDVAPGQKVNSHIDSSSFQRQLGGRKKANGGLGLLRNRPHLLSTTESSSSSSSSTSSSTTSTPTTTSTTVPPPAANKLTTTKASVVKAAPRHVATVEPEPSVAMRSLFPRHPTDTVMVDWNEQSVDGVGRRDGDDFFHLMENHNFEPKPRLIATKSTLNTPPRDRSPASKQVPKERRRPPVVTQRPVLPAPQPEERYDDHNENDGVDSVEENSASWTKQHQPEHYAAGPDGATESTGFVANLMQVVVQTTPLALDVLNVYKDQPNQGAPKCVESLLCQVNQDWKKKGSVPAAMVPFLSIFLGWMQEGANKPALPDVLMAVRAGWIGKNCAALFPRCAHPIDRPTWVVSPVPVADSVGQPTIHQPSFKVKPPASYSPPPPPPPSSTMRSSTLRSPPLRTSTTTSRSVKKPTTTIKIPPSLLSLLKSVEHESGESSEDSSSSEEDDTHHEAHDDKDDKVSADRVDRIGEKNPAGQAKPWGKPSRLSTSEELALSDIVRGVYHEAVSAEASDVSDEVQQRTETVDDADAEEESNETDDNSDEEEETNGDILHDLKANHFVNKRRPSTKITDQRHILTVDTDPEMRPRLQLGSDPMDPSGQWFSAPAWAQSQAAYPWRPVDSNEANSLRSEEDLYDDGGRDRVSTSFTQEDAVKDVRLHEMVMQYLRDRSA